MADAHCGIDDLNDRFSQWEALGEADAQIRFLEHVEQTGHGPALDERALQSNQVAKFRLSCQRCELNPAISLLQELHLAILRQILVEGAQGLFHLLFQPTDKHFHIQRLFQSLIGS